MSVPLIDTNVIIRYLTKDDPDHSERAYRFFKRIERGELKAQTTHAVISEVIHVLASKVLYHLPRAAICDHLCNLLSLPGLRIPNKTMVVLSLSLYAHTALICPHRS
jgi:predicted nucleic acid-binding protein